MRCNWGLCEDAVFADVQYLFQVSVLDIPDLQGDAGTYWLRDKLAAALQVALDQTGVFRAVRHGGAYPVDSRTLFMALNRGSAYVVSSHLAEFDGTAAALKVVVFDAETGEVVEQLSREMRLDLADYHEPVEEWSNGVLEFFTGRPGILGARLAVVRKLEPGVKEIFVLTYGRTELRQVTFDRSLALLPTWTVDGRVVFTSYKDGAPKLFVEGMTKPLTANSGMNSGMTWSGDGSVAAATFSKDGNPEVYLVEGTTGEVRARLTHHPGIDTSPSWSPDGKELAFVTDRDGTPQIYLMKANGTRQRRITMSGTYNTSPAWHPFGPYIAYTARTGGTFQIFLLNLSTGSVKQLTRGPGDCEAPDWSPDGLLIAFSWSRRSGQDIYVMDAEGNNVRRITHDEGPYYAPVWEPLAPPEMR